MNAPFSRQTCLAGRHPVRHWICWFACMVLACLGTNVTADALTFTPCALAGSGGTQTLQAECAVLRVPLDPAKPTGASIELAVSRIAGSARPRLADALLAINGGPGGSSRELLVDLAPALRMAAGERDVIVVDQRGTGASSPLRCPATPIDDTAPSRADLESLTRNCLAALPHDPRFFTTSVAVHDLEHLRQALLLDTWTLYGISYGTRVALHYTRRHPDRVRALIVDGIVPTGLVLGANVVHNSHAALIALDKRCRQDTGCAAAFGPLGPTMIRLRDLLGLPRPVVLPHPVTGAPTTVQLGYEQLAATVRLALYAPETMATIPLLLDMAATGQYPPIAAQSLQALEQVNSSIADGMHNAVVCTEDIPFFGEPEADRSAQAKTYLGTRMIDTLKTVCTIWPRGVLDDDLHTPFTSQVPALLLSGALDPITPPENGERLLQQFPNAVHLVAVGQGHGVLARGCMPRLAAQFITAPNGKALATGCLSHTATMPLFVNSLGPPP